MLALEAFEAHAFVVVRVTDAVSAVTVHFVAVVNCRSERDTSSLGKTSISLTCTCTLSSSLSRNLARFWLETLMLIDVNLLNLHFVILLFSRF